ncbi:MAG: non-canonical purine NTP pyrophosphatase [bacterium]|nr:non-canonical purine NTP pyrophosphatase [bacterium]
MKKLLIATGNKGKLKEFKSFLSELPLEIFSLKDLKIKTDFEETGKTYLENSKNKALFYAKISGLPAISDDGGIEIDALGGEPGLKTRRWLGHESTDEELIRHMIKVSKELPENNRKAFFKAVVSFALPSGEIWSSSGEIEGIISKKPYLKLLKGYPYRSFFYLPEIQKYYHENELTREEEKIYNHRYKAVQKLIPIIKKVLSI